VRSRALRAATPRLLGGAPPSRLAAALAGLLAVLGPGCGDSASPQAAAPPVVSVLDTGSERATGFVVAAGRVVTVAHALAGHAPVRVRVGPGDVRSGRVLARDARLDLALLGVPGLRGSVVGTATTDNEERVRVAVLRGRRRVTVAAAVRRAIDAHVSAPGAGRELSRPALELEARLRAGDSGAPVLGDGGEVAGVVFARSRNSRDTAYAVDARALEQLLDAARR
jgi:S1-C subfamily serine protease